jgi:hypothetical protein
VAFEKRPIENLENIARDFEEVASRLRSIAADVRNAGLSEIELQFGYVENYVTNRLLDWSFRSEASAKRYIRNKKLEAAGAALSQRRLAEEAEKSAKTTKTRGKKAGDDPGDWSRSPTAERVAACPARHGCVSGILPGLQKSQPNTDQIGSSVA